MVDIHRVPRRAATAPGSVDRSGCSGWPHGSARDRARPRLEHGTSVVVQRGAGSAVEDACFRTLLGGGAQSGRVVEPRRGSVDALFPRPDRQSRASPCGCQVSFRQRFVYPCNGGRPTRATYPARSAAHPLSQRRTTPDRPVHETPHDDLGSVLGAAVVPAFRVVVAPLRQPALREEGLPPLGGEAGAVPRVGELVEEQELLDRSGVPSADMESGTALGERVHARATHALGGRVVADDVDVGQRQIGSSKECQRPLEVVAWAAVIPVIVTVGVLAAVGSLGPGPPMRTAPMATAAAR